MPRRGSRRDGSRRGRPGPRDADAAPTRPVGSDRVERADDGVYLVRTVPAAAARKTYRCPDCRQAIPPGVSHVMSMPLRDDGFDRDPFPGRDWTGAGDADARRHWHTPCWTRRGRLGV
jgi:hypothetical protein